MLQSIRFPERAELPTLASARIAVIGLGYVGLPLAAALGKRFPTVGYDLSEGRIAELRKGHDRTREVAAAELSAETLSFASRHEKIAHCNVYIVAVPTPVDEYKRPDLSALLKASATVGRVIGPGDVVVYESTVYPGATEEDCVPLIEEVSGLVLNRDFYVGYSPERANPGDREHTLATIVKVVAGSTPEVADLLAELYSAVVPAGIHKASSIRVAEAAKVIENTQRDLNIALVNEFAIIFNRLGVDTEEVLAAAQTKWNFLPFRPGLVGGHCVGVDPYYLCHKAETSGYHPEVILAGRRINDGMGRYAATQLVKAMLKKRIHVVGARILVMGLAFKENCPDLRNTRAIDIVRELEELGAAVDVHDPWVDPAEAQRAYGVRLVEAPERKAYDGIVLAVAHRAFRERGAEGIAAWARERHVLYDLKHVLPKEAVDLRL